MPRGRNAKGKKPKTGANKKKGSRRAAFHGSKLSKTQLTESWKAEVAAAASATVTSTKPKTRAKHKPKLKPKTTKQLLQERGIDTRAGALREMLEQLEMDATGSQTDMMNKIAKLIKKCDASTSVTDSHIDVSDLVNFVNAKK